MGLPGLISLSSGRSWYRSADLGAGAGDTFRRISVSEVVLVESARQGTARIAIAAAPRKVRDTGSLLASRNGQVHTLEPWEEVAPLFIEDNCKTHLTIVKGSDFTSGRSPGNGG